MIEKVTRISNPLTIVAIFAALAEVASSVVLVALPQAVQETFVWFVMIFPHMLVALFFFVLYKKPEVMYAPSDFKDEKNFVTIIDKKAIALSEKNNNEILNSIGGGGAIVASTDQSTGLASYDGLNARNLLGMARTRERPDEAEKLCERILAHPESTSKDLELAGDMMRKAGNNGLAIKLYESAHKKDPERLSAHIELLALQAETDPKKRDESLKLAKELVSQSPSEISFARLANTLIELDRYAELSSLSDQVCQSAGGQHPKLKALALRNKAVAEKQLGNIDSAVAAFNDAFAIAPGDENILKPYLTILEEQGKYSEYLDVAKRLIEIDPADFTYYRIYIAALIKQQRFSEADKYLEIAKSLSPSPLEESVLMQYEKVIRAAANISINTDAAR